MGTIVDASPRVSVWIDDRHAIFRRGLVACLSADDFVVRGESRSLRPLPRTQDLDVLLFEYVGANLRDAVRLSQGGRTRLVATIADPDEAVVYLLVEAGVAAILPHAELTVQALTTTIRAVACGAAAMPADLMPRLLHHVRQARVSEIGGLTDRERSVLRLLADGSDTHEIAVDLSFSERTVKNVVHDILVKLNCRTRAHAVSQATKAGVI